MRNMSNKQFAKPAIEKTYSVLRTIIAGKDLIYDIQLVKIL
jgi:hypothetical protein